MNIKYLLLCIIILFTSCNIEEKNLKDKKAISVVDLSSLQLNLMNKYISSKNRDSILVDSLYKPYLELWKLLCLSDESKFINWINDDMYKELDSVNIKQRELIPESIKIKMEKTASEMKNLTGYEPQGKVYIAYGRKWANLGVFGDSGTMLIDLAHKNNNSFEGITAFFAHELNHLIYAKTSKQTNTLVLNHIINEGFACYMSYIFHKNTTISEELAYSHADFETCKIKEDELIALLKDNYLSDNTEIRKRFASRSYKFNDEFPSAVGYYIGFRIIEEYIKRNGKDSWKDIYTMSSLEVLEKSHFIK